MSYPRTPQKKASRLIQNSRRLWKFLKRYTFRTSAALLLLYLFFTPNDVHTIKIRVQSLAAAVEVATAEIKAWSKEG